MHSEEEAEYENDFVFYFVFFIGSELCSYELAAHRYPSLPERTAKCPKLPVPPRYVNRLEG